jgi:aryl-alcohol dehydrogenase
MDITAALLTDRNVPFEIVTLTLEAPREDEILVRIAATGLCHTDLAVRDGTIPLPQTPMVLGHEGAGIVAALGAAVRGFEVGDHVVLSYATCGICPACVAGAPFHCTQFMARNFMGTRVDGSCTHAHAGAAVHGSFFGQSSFATYALSTARNTVKVPKDLPLASLAPLGCGIQTGAGTILNHLKPAPGSSLAVFGAGAVGLSAIMAAKIAGCGPIIAVDLHESRLALARELGATHVLNATEGDVVGAIKQITGGGAAYVVEATGVPRAVATAMQCCRWRGDVVLLGAGDPGAAVTVPLGALQAGTIRAVIEGDSDPAVFIPQLIALHREGRFPFERLITYFELGEINRAAHEAETGGTVKAVIRMPGFEEG